MESKGVVKVDPRAPPDSGRRWAIPAVGAVVVLVIGVLAGLGNFRGTSTEVPEETVPDLGPDMLESAVLVVEEFAIAWNRGDAAAADGLILEEVESVVLPGFVDSFFGPRDERETLTEGIGFLTSVTRLSLGPCTAELAHPDSSATAVVRCEEAGFQGDYREAVRRNIWQDMLPDLLEGTGVGVPGITFGIQRDRIVSIDLETDRFAPQAYCIWAEQTRPELAVPVFDLHCRPTTAAADGAAHAALAEGFVAAGSPLPALQLTEARLAASYVDRFVELHNVADTASASSWLSSLVSAADLPGFPGADEDPPIADYLPWSARLMQLETGRCTVELDGEHTIVTCPDMAVTGLLVEDPLPQPTRFVVDSHRSGNPIARAQGRILTVEPLSDDEVPVEEVCRGMRRFRPTTAAHAFTGNCRPEYTADAADALAMVLAEE